MSAPYWVEQIHKTDKGRPYAVKNSAGAVYLCRTRLEADNLVRWRNSMAATAERRRALGLPVSSKVRV